MDLIILDHRDTESCSHERAERCLFYEGKWHWVCLQCSGIGLTKPPRYDNIYKEGVAWLNEQ